MPGVVPDVSELTLLNSLIASEFDGAKVRLFKNDFVPDAETILGDFTAADFPGYAEITLETWSAAYTNEGGRAQTDHPMVTWTVSDDFVGQTIYGMYVVNAGGDLLWCELATIGPVELTLEGQTYSLTPSFVAYSQE